MTLGALTHLKVENRYAISLICKNPRDGGAAGRALEKKK